MKVLLFILVALLAVSYAKRPLAHMYMAYDQSKVIEDSWLVVFYPNTSVELRENHMQKLASIVADKESIGNTWNINNAFLGYHGVFTNKTIYQIRSDPIVQHVEQDAVVSIAQGQCTVQQNAVWNLVRLVSDRPITTNGPYGYNSAAGSGTTIYIIDTGILLTHVDFGGRATFGANFIDTNNADCNGHGTHVAGTTAGTTYGVAKQAALVAVKVLNCAGSGTLQGVTNGINWVGTQGAARKVVNLSLGGGFSASQNQAINALAQNSFVAVAAGNSNTDLANTSPASAACNGGPTWAVGATANTDARATFSNYGSCLNVYAPGQAITSDWIGSNTAINTISGTSMASPLVAGAGSLLWSYNQQLSATQLRSQLADQYLHGQVSNNPGTTPNNFIHLPNCP
jgi:subtilisin family serine protease